MLKARYSSGSSGSAPWLRSASSSACLASKAPRCTSGRSGRARHACTRRHPCCSAACPPLPRAFASTPAPDRSLLPSASRVGLPCANAVLVVVFRAVNLLKAQLGSSTKGEPATGRWRCRPQLLPPTENSRGMSWTTAAGARCRPDQRFEGSHLATQPKFELEARGDSPNGLIRLAKSIGYRMSQVNSFGETRRLESSFGSRALGPGQQLPAEIRGIPGLQRAVAGQRAGSLTVCWRRERNCRRTLSV